MIKLYSNMRIQFELEKLGRQVSEKLKYEDDVVFVSFLKGSVMFTGDFLKNYVGSCKLEFIDLNHNISEQFINLKLEDKTVILLTDIVSTGKTIRKIKEIVQIVSKPKDLYAISLIVRGHERALDVDFHAFNVLGNEHVVGYGLDFKESYRNNPDICIYEANQR